MFDYTKFENDIVQQLKMISDRWITENDDLYILSLDCAGTMDSIGAIANTSHYLTEQAAPDSEEYWHDKYCEEEWDLFHTFEDVSADMRKYLDDNSDVFTNPKTFAYTEAFHNHCDKITGCCKNALVRFRQSTNQAYSEILLTFHIREYLDEEERMEIFKRINSENASKEYSEHMEEFA